MQLKPQTTLTSSINSTSGRIVDNDETLMNENVNAVVTSIYTNVYNTMNAISDISGAIASLRIGPISGLKYANVGLENIKTISSVN